MTEKSEILTASFQVLGYFLDLVQTDLNVQITFLQCQMIMIM